MFEIRANPAIRFLLTILTALLLMTGGQVLAGPDDICGIYVSTSGNDNPAAGLSMATPCRTINYGIGRAAAEGLTCVFVQVGQYSEVVTMVPGVDVQGGFDISWDYDTNNDANHEVRILGGYDSATQQYLAVKAINIHQTAILENVVVDAPNASGVINGNGRSSYGVLVIDSSDFEIWNSRIFGGDGAQGPDGANGSSASQVQAPSGYPGQPGAEFSSTCNTSYTQPGAGAINGGDAITRGGYGGAGGSMDTSCGPFNICSNCDARPGFDGQDADINSPSYGYGGDGGNPCQDGFDGDDGRIYDGTRGGGGGAAGLIFGDFWYGSYGASGTLGYVGTGGGGGGGGGGCDTGTDSRGGGGGGGGAGGLAAPLAGQRGGGGGGSFCLYTLRSYVQVRNCEFYRGNGGDGGLGGYGGVGQPGGWGGTGGPRGSADPGAGGDGGNGGRGGHSGGGGGGAGGHTAGILSRDSTILQSGLSYFGGSGGGSGPGGGGPLPGYSGANGATFVVYTFSKSEVLNATGSDKQSICDLNACLVADVGDDNPLPTRVALLANVPNPFNPSTEIFFDMPKADNVEIRIFDLTGRLVRRLVAGDTYPAGRHSVMWNGRGDQGQTVASGSYLVRMQVGGELLQRKVMLMK